MSTHAVDAAALEQRIAELERELLNATANDAPSLVCLVDPDGRVRPTATNRAFETTLGYRPGRAAATSSGRSTCTRTTRPTRAPLVAASLEARKRLERNSRGLADRVAALGGTFEVARPAAGGTTIRAEIPLR